MMAVFVPIEMVFSCIKVAIKRLLNEHAGIILDRGAAAAANQTLTAYCMGHLCAAVDSAGPTGIHREKMANWHAHSLGYVPQYSNAGYSNETLVVHFLLNLKTRHF